MAVNGNDLYVVDYGSGTIGEYDATTGAAINADLVTGLSVSQHSPNGPISVGPAGVAYSNGDLFVTKHNGTIEEFKRHDGCLGKPTGSHGRLWL